MTEFISPFFAEHQLVLWIITVFEDLGFAVLAYRLFGRTGLYGVVIFSLLLANIMGPKLTIVAGRPAMGKSAWMLNACENMSRRGIPTLYF